MQDEQSNEAVAPKASPGTQLRDAREALAMSQEDVCRELKTMVSQVRAIEEDRFDDLPGDAFVRGYLRGYASLVGLNGSALVDQYKAMRPEEAKLVGIEPTPRMVWPQQLLAVVLIGAAFGAVALGGFKAYQYYTREPAPVIVQAQPESFEPAQSTIEQSSETLANAEQALSESAFEESVEEIDLEAQAVSQDADFDAATAAVLQNETDRSSEAATNLEEDILNTGIESVDSGDAIADNEQVTSAPEQRVIGSGNDSLTLMFTAESWVRVRDEATLDLILNEIVGAGQVIRIRHTGAMDVRLGYAPGVQVRFNGEPVSFRIRQDTNTAKFVVGDE